MTKNVAAQVLPKTGLAWITLPQGAPYFSTETGEAWMPIGQNDAISWPELQGLFRRRDMPGAEAYLRMLSEHGVSCLRLMLEYCQVEHRYLENPTGQFSPNMIRLWDDLFALCEKYGLRILLTPYDTFWMWIRWQKHPYNKRNGGPCARREEWLLCPRTREAIKNRLAFVTARWGGSGALFAWDLWNEIHPAHAGNSCAVFPEFIEDISRFLRATEERLHGRSHLQTVSIFGPVLEQDPSAAESIFRHPCLDFANSHFYEYGTIDNPKNTVDPALAVGRLTRRALREIEDGRPFFDSEHGPIHSFKDFHLTFPEPFDDEYFRYIQWAHLASGGAGGGMRWPNRHPHSLTPGMRLAQQAMAKFLPLIDWARFRRSNWNEDVCSDEPGLATFACGDTDQALLWLLRTTQLQADGRSDQGGPPAGTVLGLPEMAPGFYQVSLWDTLQGRLYAEYQVKNERGNRFPLQIAPFRNEIAVALQRIGI